MFKVDDIFAGWITFEIGDKMFTDSYLDDFKSEMDYLFGVSKEYDYNGDIEGRAIELDGEGSLLKLSITKGRYEDVFSIMWWLNDEPPLCMVFDYEAFTRYYKSEMDRVKEAYKKDFLINY